jgi:hypothetical protein
MDVELYEGAAGFSLPLKVAPGTPPRAQDLVVNAQAQSGNNSICLPPARVKVEIPVTIARYGKMKTTARCQIGRTRQFPQNPKREPAGGA